MQCPIDTKERQRCQPQETPDPIIQYVAEHIATAAAVFATLAEGKGEVAELRSAGLSIVLEGQLGSSYKCYCCCLEW